MFSLYVFALIIGGGLLVFSTIGGHDSHHGDVGHGDLGDGDAGGHHAHDAWQWLSLRTLTYFMFVFGGVGAILTKTWHVATMPLILVLSLVAGLGVGAAVSLVFGYLKKTDSGSGDSDDGFIGLNASVTLPIAKGGMGKVLVQRGPRTYELLARPHDGAAKGVSKWKSVIVVEMKDGTALVAPSDDPAYKEIESINHSQE
jgi:hypothetical protein